MRPLSHQIPMEKAHEFLADHAWTRQISEGQKAVLMPLLEDYFWARTNRPMASVSEKWNEVAKVLISLPKRGKVSKSNSMEV